MSVGEGVIVIIIVLVGWDIKSRLAKISEKFDRIYDYLDGLREYLYEIDPQFDDERAAEAEFNDVDEKGQPKNILSGMDQCFLERDKKAAGRRTLHTTFHNRDDGGRKL